MPNKKSSNLPANPYYYTPPQNPSGISWTDIIADIFNQTIDDKLGRIKNNIKPSSNTVNTILISLKRFNPLSRPIITDNVAIAVIICNQTKLYWDIVGNTKHIAKACVDLHPAPSPKDVTPKHRAKHRKGYRPHAPFAIDF